MKNYNQTNGINWRTTDVIVKLREMPLDHAIRRANLAALLQADGQATKKFADGNYTARWHITVKPVSL